MLFRRLHICLAVLALVICAISARAATTAFTYQGKLTDASGQPANGSYTMLFRLWDSATGGSQVETTITKTGVPVSGGLFTVELDFGAVPFRLGSDRWLEVEVGSQTLSPRAKITSVPMAVYAQTAQSVPWTGITGTPANLPPGGIAGGDLTGTYPNPSLAASEGSLAKVSGGAMTASGGKVGVGTASPANVFEVVGRRGVRDQECNNTANMVTSSTYRVLAQSFTAGVSGVLSAIEIEITEAESNTTLLPVTLTIYDGDGPTGTVLCTQSIGVTSGLTYRAFPLATPVAVTAGSIYTFELNPAGKYMAVKYSTDDTYIRGRLFENGQINDSMKDINFRTYVVGSTSTGLVVQPSSLNVGIGTMWPAAALDVAGRAKVGEFQLGTYTTAGHVLTADAKGVGTWQAAPTSLPPSGTAGGDLAGTYPNPTIADGKVDSLALSRDQGSLNKVSGGVLTSLNGQIGVGTTTPGFPLSFSDANGDKVSLWGNSANHYGFGIQPALLQMYTDSSGSDIAFGYGSSANFNETVRIKNNGRVGIGTSTPEDALAINGALRVDQNSLNGNTLGPGAVRFGGGATGEGIACNRSNGTAGENQWGLDFYTHNVRRMSITLDGYIGIGTTNPAYKLHVNGSVAGVGAYNQLSDARYKTNVTEIPSALEKVESLRGVTFDWKKAEHPEIDFGDGRQAGVLAQEVQQVLPEAVTKSADGTYSVSYSSLVPLLIEAIKEQQKQIDGLKSELEAVKARNP